MRRLFRCLVLWVSAATVLAGCSVLSNDADGRLRIAYPNDVSSFDPILGNSGNDHTILFTVYDTLVDFDPETLDPRPGLAESWDVSVPGQLKLMLRPGLTFHDGTPLDATAVKFNLDRARGEGSNVASDLANVAAVTTDGDSSVVIEQKTPDSSLLLSLSDRPGMMASPTAIESGTLAAKPVGAGPWQFVAWRRGASIEVSKFAGYWDQQVSRVDGILFTIMTNATTRSTSLLSKQQDMVIEIEASDGKRIENADGFVLSQTPRSYVFQVYIDNSSPELSDPRVREALSIAVDRQQFLEAGFFGRGAVAESWMPAGHWAAHGDELAIEHNPERARQLLAEAGYPDGLSFSMIVASAPAYVRRAEILASAWEKVGVHVDLVPLELVQATSDYFNDRRSPANFSAWTGRPDPGQTFSAQFNTKGYYNAGHVPTPGLAEELAEANATFDFDERAAHFREAADLVAQNTPIIPLVFSDLLVGYQDRVQGFQSNLLGKPKFVGIEVDK